VALKSILEVLSRKRYTAIFILTSFIFFSFGVIPKNIRLLYALIGNITLFDYIKVILLLYYAWFKNNLIHTIIIFITISLLVGITFSLVIFKINAKKKFKGTLPKSGSAGIILGILVPACLPCGIGLLSILGFASALTFLPFKGLEVGLISVVLLSYSLISIGSDIGECKSCQVEIKKNSKRI